MSQTQVQSGFIGDNSITAAQIAADAVGTTEIATDAVTTAKIAAGAVGTTEIADSNIIPAKLSTGGPSWNTAGTLTATEFSGNVTGNVTGNLTGTATTATIALNAIGVDQTWQDVKSSRAGNSTAYRNTTGKPIMVAITYSAALSLASFQVSSDGSTWITVGNISGFITIISFSYIIPNNHYYRLNATATPTIWAELR
jgi:hypothetical protein